MTIVSEPIPEAQPQVDTQTPIKIQSKRRSNIRRRLVLYISLGLLAVICGIALYGVSLDQGAIIYSTNPLIKALPPSSKYPLGTDGFGRNLVNIIPLAIENDLYVGLGAGAIVSLSGIAVGAFAAIFRGKIEEVLMRITDVFLAVPALVFALAIAGTLGHQFVDIIIALSVAGWSHLARIARSEVLTEMNKPYAEALQILGFGKSRILFRHILKNTSFFFASIIFLNISLLITILASLEFIGFSVGSLSPELGALIAQGQSYLFTDPWLMVVPAIFLVLVIGTFLLLSDELRYFDPRKSIQ